MSGAPEAYKAAGSEEKEWWASPCNSQLHFDGSKQRSLLTEKKAMAEGWGQQDLSWNVRACPRRSTSLLDCTADGFICCTFTAALYVSPLHCIHPALLRCALGILSRDFRRLLSRGGALTRVLARSCLQAENTQALGIVSGRSQVHQLAAYCAARRA